MHLIYLVRKGEFNDTLRYSLRSIAKNWKDVHITILGYKPRWIKNVDNIRTIQKKRIPSNAFYALRDSLSRINYADSFILMNDDFFLMRPIGPYRHISHWSLKYGLTFKDLKNKPGWTAGTYRNLLDNTIEFLNDQGIKYPISYDRIHIPMHVYRDSMLDILNKTSTPVLHRSAYGNLSDANIPRSYGVDAKMRKRRGVDYTSMWLSSSRISWSGETGSHIRSIFSTPCIYEKLHFAW